MGKEHELRLALALIALASLGPQAVYAGCNTIPEPPVAFRGARGTINRAFVQAGDEVRITLGDADGIPTIKDTSDLHVTVGIRAAAQPDPLAELSAAANPIARLSGTDLRLLQTSPAPPVVAFTFPDLGAYGPAIITVADGTAANVSGCDGRVAAGLLACIDTLAPPPGMEMNATTCSGERELIVLPPSNNFRDLCTNAQSPWCTSAATELRFALDKDGSAYIPMYWEKILPSPGPPPIPLPRRNVSGSTAVLAFPASLNEPSNFGRIDVPNIDYLAVLTPAGTDFPNKPLFKPDDNLPSPMKRFALGLTGKTDKRDSVLRICRRVPTEFECAAGPNMGKACHPNNGVGNCPNACSPVYSFCSGSTRHGQPCTLATDCPGGSCQRGSTCRDKGINTGVGCQKDAECPAGGECGPGLFEFRYGGRAVDHMVTIPRIANSDWRGVCNAGTYEGNACNTPGDCLFPPDKLTPQCVAFGAVAGP